MTTLLALDPGVRYPACALFADRELVSASRVKLPGNIAKLNMGERVRRIGNLIHEWVVGVLIDVPLDRLVYEVPQIYRQGKSKGDPNDLIPLALLSGYVSGRWPSTEVCGLKPREWCGQLPKLTKGDPWTSPRGELVARRLDAAERACIVSSHDAIDAVGIGLHDLERLRRRVLPGAV